jgi:dolichyl-phosphate-mannose--protein O-mannosyl transferase
MIKPFKRDAVVVLSISLVFLLIASRNLGHTEIPVSGWTISGSDQVYVDLSSQQNVAEIVFMVKTGSLNLEVSTGEPSSWDIAAQATVEGYNRWRRISVERSTRYLKIDFERSHGVANESSQVVKLSVWGESSNPDSYESLIDEQNMVQYPPTYMSEAVFDEVYYVRASEDYLYGRDPYENTHPPLGKLIIAAGILVLGNNPFGWRILGILFATAKLPVIYLLGKEVSGSWRGGLFSAFLLGFEFMHFTMGRIATIDIFLVSFSLASMLFFYRYMKRVLESGWDTSLRSLFAAVILSALGFSTKWTAAFNLAAQFSILGLIRFGFLRNEGGQKRIGNINRNVFLVLAGTASVFVFVYLLTYLPYMWLGHSLGDVFQQQWYMLSYHSGLDASHGYSSPWWSWPLLTRPVWLYVSELGVGEVSTIVILGNPAIWWVGLIVMINRIFRVNGERTPSSVFLISMFAFQWLPYSLISRSLFLYHYFLNVPIMCLAISDRLVKIWSVKKRRATVIAYLLIVIVAFALYYPVISGNPVHNSLRAILRIPRSWAF